MLNYSKMLWALQYACLLSLVNRLVTQFAELFKENVIFNFIHLFIGLLSQNLMALWMLVESLRMMDVLYGNVWSRSITILTQIVFLY